MVSGMRTTAKQTELVATSTMVGKSTHRELIASINDEGITDFDEVVFAFQTWHAENGEGDLEVVVELMDIMLDCRYYQNAEIFDYFLDLCSKPLMELKANERLSTKGVERIERYFAKLSLFWSGLNSGEKIKLGKCFRCIANAGTDPAVLRCEREEWVNDGHSMRVTDKKFIQLRMRESEALDQIVLEFIAVTEALNYDISEGSTASQAASQAAAAAEQDPNADENDPAFYGVPMRTLNLEDAAAIPEETILDIIAEGGGTARTAEEEGEEGAAGLAEGGSEVLGGVPRAASGAEGSVEAPAVSVSRQPSTEEAKGGSIGIAPESLAEQEGSATGDDAEVQFDENGVPIAVPQASLVEGDGAEEAFEAQQALLLDTAEEVLETRSEAEKSPGGRSLRSTTSQTGKFVETPAIVRNLSQVLLDLCCELSADPENANIMCLLGICDGVITLMEKDSRFNPRENRLSYAVELMWNCLENFLEQARQDNAATASEDPTRQYLLKAEYVIDLMRAVEVLKGLLNYRLCEGYRLSDKELRNEVVILLIMLAEFPSSIGHFMRSELFNMLVTYACIEEMTRSSWAFFTKKVAKSRNFATLSDIDLEFKKEVWFLISACLRTNDPDALLCMASSPLLACLLQYLETDSTEPVNPHLAKHNSTNQEYGTEVDVDMQFTYSMASMLLGGEEQQTSPHSPTHDGHQSTAGRSKSNPLVSNTASTLAHGSKKHGFIASLPLPKLREYQLFAMTFLVHNCSKVLGEFERLDGPAKIIALTLKYYRSETPEHKTLVYNALILLNRCLINSLAVRHFMNDNNLIQTFLFLFSKSDHEETRSQAVRLISSLCSNGAVLCQKQLKALEGIPKLIVPIQDFSRHRKPLVGTKAGVKLVTTQEGDRKGSDPMENPYGGDISILVVAILDCLNNAVVGNPMMEAHFADEEGIDTLLDLLEIAPFVLRIQVLRLIANILRNTKLTGFVNAWRSPKTLRSAAQMLCHAWLDEEVRLNGERTENGIICDIYAPFGNHQWPLPRVNNVTYNQSALDAMSMSTVETGAESLLQQAVAGTLSASALPNTAKSLMVTKLATAILAGRNATQSNLPVDVCDHALQRDSRVVIASALSLTGVFDMYGIQEAFNPLKPLPAQTERGSLVMMGSVEDAGLDGVSSPMQQQQQAANLSPTSRISLDKTEDFNETNQFTSSMVSNLFTTVQSLNLTPSDRQVLSMAKKYQTLRSGDWWQEVRADVSAQGIVPIEADREWMEEHLEGAFDVAQAVQLEQMELYDEDQRLKKAAEDGFIDRIIYNKNQQIKAEWLKRQAKLKGQLVKGNRKSR